MAGLADKIRKRKREEHRKKKEEERRKQEEQRKAEEAKREKERPCDENDGYARVYGKYGWQWIPRDKKNTASEPENEAGVNNNGEVAARPPAMRSLNNDLGSSSFAPKSILSNGTSGPVSFLSNTVDASPQSDVTCSQSPSKSSKPRAVAFSKSTTIKEEENDNEAVVDPIMAIMMRKEAKKQQAKVKVADSPSVQSNSSERNDAKDDPIMDEMQRRLSQGSAPKLAHDPMEIARKKQEERARIKDESEEEEEENEEESSPPRAEAKNPFALMRHEDRRSLSPQGRANDSAGPVHVAPAADLWEDSEEDEEAEKKKKKQKGKKRGRPKKNPPPEDDEQAESPPARKAPPKKKASPSSDASPKKKASLKSKPRRREEDDSSSDSDSDSDIDSEQDDVLIPTFRDPKMGPPSALEPMELPRAKDQNTVHVIPASINRYLRGYQQQGVTFMYSCIMRKSGGILGDDMGLGKTVQVISLLAALFGKTGTGKDASELSRRRRLISQKLREIKAANDQALLFSRAQVESPEASEIEGLSVPEWAPVLVIVPSSVIGNWENEFKTWGHFGVSTYQGKGREVSLEKVKTGVSEVLLCSKALGSSSFTELATVRWKLIIVDEYHCYKNNKSKAHEKLRELRDLCRCPIIGLTGTVMPNKHEELFHLVDLVAPGHFGDSATFKTRFSKPIKYARTKAADAETIRESLSCQHELDVKLKQVYIQRNKEDELGDEMPEKNETILFCEPTAIQKALYENILTLPDLELLRYANAPCDCGVNRGIFMGYKRLRTKKERINYTRMHKTDIRRRKECCYKTPLNPARGQSDDEPHINPNAPLWRFQHPDDEECEMCPYCVQFPAINKLYKLSNHAALLLAEQDPGSLEEGSQKWVATTKDVAFAKAAIPPQILAELPGGDTNPYVRQDNVMNDHAKFSGKMEKLDLLLRAFDRGDNRVLVFSHYTKTLDLIQQFVSACGYSYLRLDGSTSTSDRTKLVDQYQNDPTIFLFLISTKAGGLGLNLTAANKVICFDLDFNPSHDEQAQDRSYRVGQKKDVQVVRLIASGTIEEQKYIRQIYKVHLKNDTIKDTQETGQARMFRAVQGDKSRKGEVFGIENLLKYKDGSFMSDFWKTDSRSARKDGTVRAEDLSNAVNKLSEEQVEDIGGNTLDEHFHQAAASLDESDSFTGAARGNAALKQDDDDDGDAKRPSVKEPSSDEEQEFDDIAGLTGVTNTINPKDFFRKPEEESDDEVEVLGGCSQGMLAVFDRGRSDDDASDDGDNEDGSDGGNPPPAQADFPLQPPPRAAYPPLQPPPMEATPSPTPDAVSSREEETREDDVLPQKRSFASLGLEAALDDINDDGPPPAQEEQESIEVLEPEPKKPKKKKAATSTKAAGKEKSKATNFSASDLVMPVYKKKKKKTKK